MVVYPPDFWDILSKFPSVRSLNDLTKILVDAEVNGFKHDYPVAFRLLIEFESSMRSHIYTEWHAQEYDYDTETSDFA